MVRRARSGKRWLALQTEPYWDVSLDWFLRFHSSKTKRCFPGNRSKRKCKFLKDDVSIYPEFPIFEIKIFRNSKFQKLRNPEIQKSWKPEIQKSRKPEIQIFRNPEIQKSRNPEIQKFINPEIQKSRKPEIQKSKNPEIHYAKIQKSRKPEIQKSRNLENQNLEIQKSRNPETHVPSLESQHLKLHSHLLLRFPGKHR